MKAFFFALRFKAPACLILLAMFLGAFITFPVKAETPVKTPYSSGNFIWADRMGGNQFDQANSISTDSSGNIYITGKFRGTADFDPGAATYNLISSGYDDIFISKLDSNGNLIWAKALSGMDFEEGYGIAVDSNGSVYVTGYYFGTVDFDPGVGVHNLTSMDGSEIFIAKLDSNGNYVWAESIGNTGYDEANEIVTDSNGNIYVTGCFSGTVDFDPGIGVTSLTSAGAIDIFVLKMDGNGGLTWAMRMGGTQSETGNGLALDTNKNIYITGSFEGISDFDPSAASYALSSAGLEDVFVSKLDNNGNFVWAKGMGGTGSDLGIDISLDSDGNLYTTGSFSGTSDFDPSVGIFTLSSIGGIDIFASKLTNNGAFLWANSMGGTGNDRGLGIMTDPVNGVYLTGYFEGTVDFDPGAGTHILSCTGYYDIFVSKLDINGIFVNVKQLGGDNLDIGNDIALGSSGSIYTTGIFTNVVDFDPGIGTFSLTSAGMSDIFVSKLEAMVPALFTDVPFSYWANSYIERLYNAGITGGCSTSPMMYCPGNSVTRAQMAVFLLRGEHGSAYTPPDATGTVFGDVPLNHPVGAWIEQLASEGITGGCGNGNYCPDAPVTRAQMAIFLLRAKHGAAYVPPAATGVFTDVPVSDPFSSWIEQLAAEGITGGCSTSPMMYCPANVVTRDQMAVFLVRAFNLP